MRLHCTLLFSEFKICGNWFVRIAIVLYYLIPLKNTYWRFFIISVGQMKMTHTSISGRWEYVYILVLIASCVRVGDENHVPAVEKGESSHWSPLTSTSFLIGTSKCTRAMHVDIGEIDCTFYIR